MKQYGTLAMTAAGGRRFLKLQFWIRSSLTTGLLLLLCTRVASVEAEEHPLSQKERTEVGRESRAVLHRFPPPQAGAANAIQVHSRRGDALLFLGQFEESVAEYRAMVSVDPDLDASHWRLGIALFFADRPKEAAAQFDKYHSYDDVDRENGIWRYLSHYKAFGSEKAAAELLRYAKDDREPFPAVYRLFEGTLKPADALAAVAGDLPPAERDKRLFYTELYIGMQMVVSGRHDEAVKYLQLATGREWPRRAGFGPKYMWHVGRVQLESLMESLRPSDTSQGPGSP